MNWVLAHNRVENLMGKRWDKPIDAPWGSRVGGEEGAMARFDPWVSSRSYRIVVQVAGLESEVTTQRAKSGDLL